MSAQKQESIYEAPGDDYPTEETGDVIGATFLLEEYDIDVAPPLREEPLDARIARRTYAYATRQEKYELYKRFRDSVEPDSLHPSRKRKVNRY